MAIKIGTNIDYQAPYFLDKRQEVSTKDELLNYSTSIPANGFEVFCVEDKKWYVKSNTWNNSTGYFQERITKELNDCGETERQNIQDDKIKILENEVFPFKATLDNTALYYEIGEEVFPEINGKVTNWDNIVSATVQPSDGIPQEVIRSGLNFRYRDGIRRSNDLTYSVKFVKLIDGQRVTVSYQTVTARFRPYVYLLVSSLPIIQSKEEITEEDLIVKDFYKDTIELSGEAKCSGNELEGGKYIHFLIPALDSIEVTVDNIKTTSFDLVNEIPEEGYYDFRLTYKQNGDFNIKLIIRK